MTDSTEDQPAIDPTPELSELNQLKNELDEYKDKYFRLLAESENARKRLQKEKQDLIQYAVADVVVDFLNPIDHMETALKHANKMSDEVKHWAVGFNMILSHFKDVLANKGVQPFESTGTHFDPHHHEAVEVIPTDNHPAGTVVEELMRGYRMGGRTIRPARVKVAKELPPLPEENAQDEIFKNENKENNNDQKI